MGKNFLRRFLFVLMMATWSLVITQSIGFAQVTFPTRPVTIWVAFPPGGGTDTIIRTIAEETGKSLGQKIVVVNKPGGGGTVCTSLIAKEKPDGYTLAGITNAAVTVGPHLTDLDYDPFRDLSFIIQVAAWKSVFVVRPDSPFKKWEDVVDWAKKNPGQLIFGNPGIGTNSHISMAKIAIKERFTYRNVPFAGDAPSVAALLGGHVMVAGGGVTVWQSQIEAKNARAILAVEKELSFAPDIPTFQKVHYDFGIMPTTVLICGPAGIPDPVRQILEKAFSDGMKTEAFNKLAKTLELFALDPLTGTALLDSVKKSYVLYEGFIKEVGAYKSEKKGK
jgi:tripartite-type tricarboxylate transporter receptor subunit TctC